MRQAVLLFSRASGRLFVAVAGERNLAATGTVLSAIRLRNGLLSFLDDIYTAFEVWRLK